MGIDQKTPFVVDYCFLPTVDRDRSVLAKLLFCFMHLANKVNKALS